MTRLFLVIDLPFFSGYTMTISWFEKISVVLADYVSLHGALQRNICRPPGQLIFGLFFYFLQTKKQEKHPYWQQILSVCVCRKNRRSKRESY